MSEPDGAAPGALPATGRDPVWPPPEPAAAAEPPPLLGLAHVASCSFLASRLAPGGQFWVALAGGLALAQAGGRHGLRAGYGASLAAIVQTVALIGPARVNGPLTQALNAPLMGRLQARGAPRAARLGAGLAIRLAHYAALNVVFIVLVVGGLDAYVATYDRIADFTRVLPTGTPAAVGLTIAGALMWAIFYTTIQTLTYERAFARWPATAPPPEGEHEEAERPPRPRFPAVALLATAAAWVVLLATTAWIALGAVALALTVATAGTRARRAGRDVWAVGVGLSLVLAIGALGPALIGAVEWEGALQRALRAALLVLTATWTRALAGSGALREAARRTLWRVRRVPAAAEAATITEGLESDRHLMPAARDLIDRLQDVPHRPLPVADALADWVAAEAARYRPPAR